MLLVVAAGILTLNISLGIFAAAGGAEQADVVFTGLAGGLVSACTGIRYTTSRISGNIMAIKYSGVIFFMHVI